MSKYTLALLVAGSLTTFGAAFADEVSSTTTRTDNPDYSASSTSTTTEQNPGAVSSESKTTTSETSPYGQQVTTKRSYSKAPCAQKTTRTDSSTTISR